MNDDLLQVLYDTQKYLARSDADFAWSSWKDQEAALNEVDLLIERVRRGRFPKRTLDVLFLPTGPIQEVSLSSGWGDEFLALADRYDKAFVRAVRARPWWKFW